MLNVFLLVIEKSMKPTSHPHLKLEVFVFKTVIKTERFHDVSPCEFWFETFAGVTFESFCASVKKQDF